MLLLQNRRAATAREIATNLGISMRTVYRDISVLSGLGVPVYAETGRAGGYRLVDGYRTTLTGLTAAEALALFLIGMPVPAELLGLGDRAQAVEAKLLAALSPGQREEASRLRHRFLLDLPAWYQNAEAPPALPTLAEAVLTDRRVQVRYRRWNEPRVIRRLLQPYGLVVKNGAWYLVAAGSRPAGPHTYRVSNILQLQPRADTFSRPLDFDLAAYWRDHLDDFNRRRITGIAHVRISPALLARLDDVGTATLRTAATTGQVDDTGWTVIEFPMESPDWAATQLIRYGGDIEILEPVELRAAISTLAQAVLDKHRSHHNQRHCCVV